MFILNRAIHTRIDRGMTIDSAKLFVYDVGDISFINGGYKYFMTPLELDFKHLDILKNDDRDFAIMQILDVYRKYNLGMYVPVLEDVYRILKEKGEEITEDIGNPMAVLTSIGNCIE